MGIPSFYRHLIRKAPQLVKPLQEKPSPDLLAFDFNCAIYLVLREVEKQGISDKQQFEKTLFVSLRQWLSDVVDRVGPKRVFIAVDGVCPMAKIKQQRLRRFRAPWWSAIESCLKNGGSIATNDELKTNKVITDSQFLWDKNAITPGTDFMRQLTVELSQWAIHRNAAGIMQVTLSSSDEPGEGEHKIMQHLRTYGIHGDTIIYGLDADLILLSIIAEQQLQTQCRVHLMREAEEFNKTATKSKKQEYSLFDIGLLQPALFNYFRPSGTGIKEWIQDFVTIMSLVGNDFVPALNGFHIREEGIETLMKALDSSCKTIGKRLCDAAGTISQPVLLAILQQMATQEDTAWRQYFVNKLKWSGTRSRGTTDAERAWDAWQDEPMHWHGDNNLYIQYKNREGDERTKMRENWRDVYHSNWLHDDGINSATEWLRGMQWVNNYYRGSPINTFWVYPWSHPPLVTDLVAAIRKMKTLPISLIPNGMVIRPIEQLCMVLPISSWSLLPLSVCRRLYQWPQYFPEGFGMNMLGKRFLWESEAEIALLPYSLAELAAS